MPDVAYVAQPNGYGCAIACCAMIAGRSYEAMERWFIERGFPAARLQQGIYCHVYQEALDQHGYTYVQRFRFDPSTQSPRGEWPPVSFAPVHIAEVHVAAGAHAVVMLGDGRVLDPFTPERKSMAHPDYIEVCSVTGFYPRMVA